MADRRIFLEAALVSCGSAVLVPRTAKFMRIFHDLFPQRFGLPDKWEFYEMDGQVLFPMFSKSGSLCAQWCCWLIQNKSGQWWSIPVAFDWQDMDTTNGNDEAAKALCIRKIREAIQSFRPVPVNMDGGEFPLPQK